MASQQSASAAGTATAGSLASSALQVEADAPLVVEDFSSWPGENALGEYSGAGQFDTASGEPEVVDGALRLEYDDAGWFLTNVRSDVSDYATLEIDVRGDEGGEADGIQLEVGAVEGPLDELAEGSIGTETATLSVDLEAAGVDRSSLDDVWLNFWRAGSGAIEIEELRFVPEGGVGACADAAGGSLAVDGQTVCDLNDDGSYRDVTGDGDLGQDDVVAFFENQHRSAWKQDAFDFSGNGEVNQFDVVDLFEYVLTS